jgi:hypothetical protein
MFCVALYEIPVQMEESLQMLLGVLRSDQMPWKKPFLLIILANVCNESVTRVFSETVQTMAEWDGT